MTELTPQADSSDAPLIQIGSGKPVPFVPGQEYRSTATSEVDVNFIFDTTGSMTDKIDGLVASTVDLVRELATLSLDWRVTTVPFGDLTIPGDEVVSKQPFVTTHEAAEKQLRTMPRFSGGGNEGESSLEAIDAALRKSYRRSAVKILVLITDEPALQNRSHNINNTGRALREAEVIFFAATPDLPYFKQWAKECGGAWVPVGQTMDTRRLRELLRALVQEVARVASDVNQLAGGSVRQYLALPSRPDRSIGS